MIDLETSIEGLKEDKYAVVKVEIPYIPIPNIGAKLSESLRRVDAYYKTFLLSVKEGSLVKSFDNGFTWEVTSLEELQNEYNPTITILEESK
jgi:hypothetical protein